MRQFLATESGTAGVLLAAALTALVWANSPWSTADEELWATEVALEGASISQPRHPSSRWIVGRLIRE